MGQQKHLSHTSEALRLLGLEISRGRRRRHWTLAELAERCGVAINTVRSIEAGAPSVKVGTVFDAALLVGVPIFSEEPADLRALLARAEMQLAVLPKRVRTDEAVSWDEF